MDEKSQNESLAAQETKFYQLVYTTLCEHPEWARVVVDAMTAGIRESNERLSEKITNRDKALLVLFDGTAMGSEQNLQDTADVLTDSRFNGQNKKYTIEDIQPFLIRKRGRPKSL